MAYFEGIPEPLPGGLKIITRIFSHNNECPGRNSNSACSECKPDKLQLQVILFRHAVADDENMR